jgi:hypothetical protein
MVGILCTRVLEKKTEKIAKQADAMFGACGSVLAVGDTSHLTDDSPLGRTVRKWLWAILEAGTICTVHARKRTSNVCCEVHNKERLPRIPTRHALAS